MRAGMTGAHYVAKAAIKARWPELPVGRSLAICDDDGGEAVRDRKRAEVYDCWLRLAADDDFAGVQNYERLHYGHDGLIPPAPDAVLNGMGTAVDPASLLAAAIASGVPVLGYCHWMLMDNIEWIFGYGPKLGLHSVDPTTFERTSKPSAGVYAGLVRAARGVDA